MNALTILALATPVWGFALQAPAASPAIAPDHAAQIRGVVVADEALDPDLDAAAEAQNLTWMNLTRGFSVASTVGFVVTNALGLVQYADEYGFHDDYSQTACATQDQAVDYCEGATPWHHVVAVGATGVLSLAGLGFSTQVDFDRASRMDGDWRTYEVTRWIPHVMVAVQAIGGILLANAVRWGWADQERDFDTMHGFALAHMALGAATLGVELYNTILIF